MTPYLVHGLTRSYFTRKVVGYLDYTDRPWRLEPCPPNLHPAAAEAGWTGGIPVVAAPDGTLLWDSTMIIEHLGHDTPASHSVLPDDPTLRFVTYLIDDFSDEWLYRPAVGSRWSYPASVLPGNIDAWMSEVLVPWFQVLDAHLRQTGYLFGDRPSLADFAVFGGNAAHFVGDPYCRELADAHGPGAVSHTHRLQQPQRQTFGEWIGDGTVSDPLLAVVAEAGRHYLPWVAQATVNGSASVDLGVGEVAEVASSAFLDNARGVMLGRYVAAKTPELDAVLEQAGVLHWFADYVDQAIAVPDTRAGAQPQVNRPYSVD